jgi:hypothetical protein
VGIFTRRTDLPPTRYGYVPPANAMPTGWICVNEDCGHGDLAADHRRWPRSCPECGSPIATNRLEMPWQHFAKRVEIDARIESPRWEGDLSQAMTEDLVWRCADAVHNGDPSAAENLRQELDAHLVRTESTDPYFNGGTSRWEFVEVAMAHNLSDLAVRELDAWRAAASLTNLENDNARRTNARQLASRLIAFLENPAASGSPQRDHVWAVLSELMARIEGVATADQTEGFARLTRVMSGGNQAEEQLISRLERLRTADTRRPSRGLPTETPFRMEVIARQHFTTSSGIPWNLVWEVCMAPYLPLQSPDPDRFAADLAATVGHANGWATVGASSLLQEFDRHRAGNPAFLSLLDASLTFLRQQGVGSAHLRRAEWERWLDTHGPGTWDHTKETAPERG